MSARIIQHRRGTTAEHQNFTGAVGEFTMDTDKKTLVVHDGKTKGGFPLAKAADLQTTSNSLSKALAGYLPLTGGTVTGNIKAPTFTGALKGNADTATKATQDGNGAAIASTYLKLSGGTATGQIVAPSFKIRSDLRLKGDVRPVDSDEAQRILDGIHTYRYKFKTSGKNAIGVIAQEVQTVLPDAVDRDSNDYLCVDYQALTAILFAVVRSQEARIRKLEGRG